jgi:hypothetical protein
MLCDGKCYGDNNPDKEVGPGISCGLLVTSLYRDEKGVEHEVQECMFMSIMQVLKQSSERMLGVQQATEGNRNVGAQVGKALVETFKTGFNKMAKAQLIKDNPALALIDDE